MTEKLNKWYNDPSENLWKVDYQNEKQEKKKNRLLWERAWYELIKALIPKDPDKLQQLLGRMNGTKENDAGLKLKKYIKVIKAKH